MLSDTILYLIFHTNTDIHTVKDYRGHHVNRNRRPPNKPRLHHLGQIHWERGVWSIYHLGSPQINSRFCKVILIIKTDTVSPLPRVFLFLFDSCLLLKSM